MRPWLDLAALNSVRLERVADQQAAALGRHARLVEAEFVAPEGARNEEAEQLRTEAMRIAVFDPSRKAVLASKVKGAAERSFNRALQQLWQMELQTEALLFEARSSGLETAGRSRCSREEWSSGSINGS